MPGQDRSTTWKYNVELSLIMARIKIMEMKRRRIIFSLCLIVAFLAACQPGRTVVPAASTSTVLILPSATAQPTESGAVSSSSTPTLASSHAVTAVRFAVIGDYGTGDQNEAFVADLVHAWKPDLVITVGDNNYPEGAAATMDEHVGQFYHDFIFPYTGKYGSGADVNRFFPTLGNHEWYTSGAVPYLDYFQLPGNERYYDFIWGPVHFFALDSEPSEPDGTGSDSVQARWLKAGLAASNSLWNVVYFHYPPYSSGFHGSIAYMRWPFAEWGADAVLSGHDHDYERLQVDGIPYIVNGLGGGAIYDFKKPLPQSVARYNTTYGAMLVTAIQDQLIFEFYNRHGKKVDWITLIKQQ
jgi:tartrate-resistant acid phosphatase type 5